jgi:hypothetical protein
VTGRTNSPNFPTAHPFQAEPGGGTCAYDFDPNAMAPCYDAFVAKLGPGGSTLKYGTYLGGSDTDFAWGIAVRDGNAYVAGQASSSDFPTANPLQPSIGGGTCGAQDTSAPCSDAFVAELNTAGDSLIYSTYLGGGADDSADAIAVDTAGNAYVVGATYSTNFPTAHAFQRTYLGSDNGMAFVSKLNAAGNALVYSTYLGGSGSDEAYGVALDRSGDAYVTGRTSSPDFPLLRAIQTRLPGDAYPQNAFVTALSPHGSSLLYSTFLGGNDHDSGNGIAVDGAGNAYVAGYASSKDFPVAHALQRALAGGTYDVFVAKVGNPSAALSHTPTATIRPTPTSTATRSPPSKPATSRTIKCKKGYRLVQGKCRKQKKHS